MRKFFYSFLIFSFIFTIFSCGKTTEENVNETVSKSKNKIIFGTGGDSGTCFDNTKAFIVGNSVSAKGCHPNCPKSTAVIWNLDGCMVTVGENSYAVDAAEHNGSIYIADDGGFYWIVGNSTTKHKLKYSGYRLSEVTGIDVNSNGDVYVAGVVCKKTGKYCKEKNIKTAYWKNG